ncbi:MAG: triose-phosphate isomerase [Dehalococcoidia bacterium]|nr:triose-phosphate isomerase [Dehalococcoidia bacterium]
MKRTPVIAGNWKMNTTLGEARALAQALRGPLDAVRGVEKIVCPPFVSLAAVSEVLRGSSVAVGAQNVYHQPKGAFTGEISPGMLAGLCTHVIIGHSERRQYFGEDDAAVNKKVGAALEAGLAPIMAVGERLEEREQGRTEAVITWQVQGGLKDIAAAASLVIAYEPVWAIGTGRAATPEEANATIGLIRRLAAGQYGDAFAQRLRILYGGSVTPENVGAIMGQREIDGGLVGGASLKAGDFITLVQRAAEAAAAR